MFVLAVLGLFAAAPAADTALRVPGTALRFGLTDSVASARGFTALQAGLRGGRCRFFGLESEVTLGFEGGRLVRAGFTVKEASRYEIAYVEDQLAAMGYRRRCEKPTPRTSVCDWTGRTRVRLEVDGARLTVTAVPADPGIASPAIPPAPDDSVRSLSRDADPVPVLPETLAVPLPHRPSRHAAATVLNEARCVYPGAARRAGVQGRVWVLALVDVDGRVLDAQATSSIPTLDAAALECVRGWRFEPRSWRGRPCRYRVEVPLTFTLH